MAFVVKMKVIAVLLLALATASAGPLPRLKAIPPRNRTIHTGSIEGRIIGGLPAIPGQIPHQVGILFTLYIYAWFCGGSVLSPHHILTAAHCTDGAEEATIYAGSIILETGVQRTVGSNNFRQHNTYNENTLIGDISIIILDDPLEFGSLINKIKLPPLNGPVETYEDKKAKVSGWGLTDDSAPIQPPALQYALVDVISNEKCNNTYQGGIEPCHLCTSVDKGQATCYGDSGGPLALYVGNKPLQIGVVSFGSVEGCDKRANGFTRVSYYRQWIYTNTGI